MASLNLVYLKRETKKMEKMKCYAHLSCHWASFQNIKRPTILHGMTLSSAILQKENSENRQFL